MTKEIFSLFTDGGARGNPGPAAIGGALYNTKDKEIDCFSLTIGSATNNVAEYKALIQGLEIALANSVGHLRCYLDSELVVKQLNKQYRVKDKTLQSLFVQVWNRSLKFNSISWHHIPREKNKRADHLVNQALDSN